MQIKIKYGFAEQIFTSAKAALLESENLAATATSMILSVGEIFFA